MPLKSRGTSLRAQRAATTEAPAAPADDEVKITQRRNGPPQPEAPPEREEPLQDEPFDTGAEPTPAEPDNIGEPPPAAERVRKKRADAGTKRPARKKTVVPPDATPTAIRARLREIEGTYRELQRAQKEEAKALEAKHVEARNALTREHAALSAQLSRTLFKS